MAKTIKKVKSTLHANKLIKTHSRNFQLKQITTSNFYSVLFYNSENWYLPTLNPHSKQQLLSASTNALKYVETIMSRGFETFPDFPDFQSVLKTVER